MHSRYQICAQFSAFSWHQLPSGQSVLFIDITPKGVVLCNTIWCYEKFEMKRKLFKAALITGILTTVLSISGLRADDNAIQNIPTDNMAWEVTEEGVGFAPLIGERFNEAYMAMVKLPAGLVSPAHVKTANMFGVVIAGTMTHLAVGADPSLEIALAEGAFYKVPAGIGHISKCISKVDCVTFLYQDGKFDFVPINQ